MCIFQCPQHTLYVYRTPGCCPFHYRHTRQCVKCGAKSPYKKPMARDESYIGGYPHYRQPMPTDWRNAKHLNCGGSIREIELEEGVCGKDLIQVREKKRDQSWSDRNTDC